MHKIFYQRIGISIVVITLFAGVSNAQTYNAAYVKALYAKYPTEKSDFCDGCRIWVNPYYTSIADTVKGFPVCEKAVVTAADVADQEAANIDRSGVFAKWNITQGEPRFDQLYTYINKQINKPLTIYEIVYGHCALAWVLSARNRNGAIFSNTQVYGEFGEYQGQNIGTMIATEDTTRLLLGATLNKVKHIPVTDSVKIWAGCISSDTSKVYSFKGRSITIPDVVWKIIKFNDQTVCYWMPNEVSESQAMLIHRHISYGCLIVKLGFDPEKVIP
ncbi:MAG TPA: hypothetical protein VGN20_20640 [Mucilaginibacter sp.]